MVEHKEQPVRLARAASVSSPVPSAFAFLAVAAHLLIFYLLYPLIGAGVAALAVLPVVVIGWLGGTRAGVIAALLSIPLNTLLLNLAGYQPAGWDVVIRGGGGPGSLALVFIGAVIGRLRELSQASKWQLAERQRASQALQASEQQYRDLLAAAERQMRERDLLDQVSTLLARGLELDALLKTVVDATAHAFGYTHVSIYLLEGDELVLQQQIGYEQVIQRFPITQGVSGRVVRTGQPVWLPMVRTDAAFLAAAEGITSEVCVPLRRREIVIGTFNIESTGAMVLTEADLRIALALSQHIGIALERAQLYSSLRESEEQYRRIIETAQEGIWIIDAQSKTTYANSKMAELLGYSPAEMLGMSLFSFMDAEGKAIAEAQVERRRQGVAEQHDFKFLHKQGNPVWAILNTTPRQDPSGKYEGALAMVTDITERKRAEEATLHRNAELSALNQLGQALNKKTEPSELLELIDTVIAQVLDSRNRYIALYDEMNQSISFPIYTIDNQHIIAPARAMANGLTEYVIRNKAPLLLSHDATTVAHERGLETQGQPARCYLGVPMLVGAKLIGVIAIRDFEREDVYDQGHLDLLTTIASQAAVALDNSRLFKEIDLLARTDPLTGVANRRHLFEAGARELLRARRFGHPLSALMLDIDQFKQVNDLHGHAAGDQILKIVARCLMTLVRDIDIVARYGGEEFVILLVETGLTGAQILAERLREQVAKTVVITDQGPLGVTISLGAASALVDSDGIDTLLVRVDGALYAAKRAGGNQVAVA